ncbi:hypothetical protein FHT40_002163 [Mycolicibacterium sp. BK556]|uniref:Imm61 family immunity protein n=1 Tax=Mycobacteriaceae TaxID=1762 RepID=UPI00105D1CE4|nr:MULTISPECIES: Imm61 family immunity protein [Mycobacteriaceae]MBB3602530.1 hypothetical protein [Mycolicibacterium sp. BK556]MBB3632282.1 hypothetical protein [Mycolicibacterium sp. BK607]MBB3750303.1 hypothetical protein [Mycolicibacterium sp. BK634]
MRPDIGLTAEFECWAHEAGYEITESSSTDARAVVWNSGGEIRYFFDHHADGSVVVTSSERMGEEQFELASVVPGLVERRFIVRFSRLVRARRGLPRLSFRHSAEDIAAGYILGRQKFWGEERFTLIDPHGRTLAVVSGGQLIGTMNVVNLSIFASTNMDLIVQSLSDPEGKPLFSVRPNEEDHG